MKVLTAARMGLVTLLLASAPLLAHHSFAMVDKTQELLLQGSVKEWQWTNPHSFLVIEVADSSGPVEWQFETYPPGALARAGVTRLSFKPGDKVKVNYFLDRSKPNFGALNSVTMQDGSEISMKKVVKGGTVHKD
ncbi:MAG: DUF6152 family protein [Steroidobacteraceae bacterium]